MVLKHLLKLIGPLAAAAAVAFGVSAQALGDEGDPPTRAARLGYVQGAVSFEPAGTEDWVGVVLNRPLTTGDRLWSADDGRAELQLDGSTLRLSNNTALAFLNLGDRVTQLQLSSGSLLLRVRRLDGDETYEVDTPNLAFSILRPGLYRLTVDETGGTTAIRVRNGAGEATGGGAVYPVGANEYDVFSGTDQLAENVQEGPPEDPFDAWGASRDSRWERSASARYVSPDVVGYEDLDEHGDWRAAPGYGNVWFPRSPGPEWAPYHSGHWAYIEPWGYTWVDDQPWGFAPFHYGRWVSVNGSWGWVPAPPRVEGVVYARPVYAPALVAWVGAGAAVAWFALGPREVYVPSYPVSRAYVNNVNVSNTTVNTTVVNNVYNTVVVNKTVNVTNVTYVNQRVPGAVAATSTQAFSTGQPVARNAVRVEARTLASAPVRVATPPIVPAKQAVLGTGRVAAAKPPAAIQARAVVAKVAPPPAPPAFEKHQEAIKQNGGKPLSVAELRRIQPPAAERAAAVKIAPPAKPGSAQKTVGAAAKPPATQGKPQTPATEANKAAPGAKPGAPPPPAERRAATTPPATPAKEPPPAKPQEAAAAREAASAGKTQAPPAVPATARPEAKKPTPSAGPPERAAAPKPAERAAPPPRNPAPPAQKPPASSSAQLEQKHAQEQEQLRAKQEQERQRVQQQQQAERQRAEEAKKQQLEKQHQQQTQQLQQKHEQEQQQLQQKQQQEKQQAAKKPPPKNPNDHSAKETP